MSTGPSTAQLEALRHFGYAPLDGREVPDLNPVVLARRWITRHRPLELQIASVVVHYRPPSAMSRTPEALPYWPCCFCSVRSEKR